MILSKFMWRQQVYTILLGKLKVNGKSCHECGEQKLSKTLEKEKNLPVFMKDNSLP